MGKVLQSGVLRQPSSKVVACYSNPLSVFSGLCVAISFIAMYLRRGLRSPDTRAAIGDFSCSCTAVRTLLISQEPWNDSAALFVTGVFFPDPPAHG